MLADADPAVHADPSAPIRVVGFADLVSFTSFVRRMSERQLARLKAAPEPSAAHEAAG